MAASILAPVDGVNGLAPSVDNEKVQFESTCITIANTDSTNTESSVSSQAGHDANSQDKTIVETRTENVPTDSDDESSHRAAQRKLEQIRERLNDPDDVFGHETAELLTNQWEALDWAIKTLIRRRDDSEIKLMNEGKFVPRVIARPEAVLMSWDEYKLNIGRVVQTNHSAIDYLVQEPQLMRTRHPATRVRLSMVSANEKLAVPSTVPSQRPGVRPLPHRIRINSMPGKRILDGIVENVLRFLGTAGHPLVLLRPYKLLVHIEQDVRIQLTRMEEDHAVKQKLCADGKPVVHSEVAEGKDFRFPFGTKYFWPFEWSALTLEESREAIQDYRLIVNFIDDYLLPLRNYMKDPQTVYFSELWHLFPAGSFVYVREKSVPQKVWRVTQAVGGRKWMSSPEGRKAGSWEDQSSMFWLNCYYLDFDGTRFVRVFRNFKLEPFPELQSVSSLLVLPLNVAEREGMIQKNDLIARGEQFLACTRPVFKYYTGRSLSHTPIGTPLQKPNPDGFGLTRIYSEPVESQVMVDFERGLQAMPDWTPTDGECEPETVDEAELGDGTTEDCDNDIVWDARIREEFMEEEGVKWMRWDREGVQPSGDDLLLLPDRVFAFVFRTRTWACLQLGRNSAGEDHLKAVKQKHDAWNDLEIPDGHKDIVQSLVESHFAKNKSEKMDFDLIRDKGKGVIVLLHGVPGVGKTSTAECVAESNNKPLLPITCGDLGLTARDVETRLQTSFELAQAWDCVLLLDEADIFLTQRTAENMERNALVSVFLRVLEYYEGILFLTTNRVGSFDEAFKSRIHMALYYPPLSWSQTEKIWKSQIRRAKGPPHSVECDETILLRYASDLFHDQSPESSVTGPVWNGRQIRNAFQSAIALAKFRTEANDVIRLKKEHFEKVAKVSDEFNHYLLRVKNMKSDSENAKSRMLRDDRFGVPVEAVALPVQQSYQFQMPSRPAFGAQNMPAASNFMAAQPQMYHQGNNVQYSTTPQFVPQYMGQPQQPVGMSVNGMQNHQGLYFQQPQATAGAQQPVSFQTNQVGLNGQAPTTQQQQQQQQNQNQTQGPSTIQGQQQMPNQPPNQFYTIPPIQQ